LNSHSSRGHTLFTLIIPPSETAFVGLPSSGPILYYAVRHLLYRARYLTFVDLAGNEDVKESDAEGDIIKEARAINASLSALKTVLSQLNRVKKVAWKDNVLTMLIGGLTGSSTGEKVDVLMLATLDLDGARLKASLSTLEFAKT
jgi:hypothetical protein